MGTSRTRKLILKLARVRCWRHGGPTPGFCHLCFRAELEEFVARDRPAMKRDDVVQLVDAWFIAASRLGAKSDEAGTRVA